MRKVPGIVLRGYRSMDIDAMFRLDEACFAEEFRFSRRSMKRYVEASGAVVVVGETGGKLAGFVIVHIEDFGESSYGYVVTLDVAEGWRRMGLAQRMMLEAERCVTEAGASGMALHVFTGNEGAIRFYERMGYERMGMQRRFYGKPGLDAFVYRRELQEKVT
jgi:[ribosomal protein S18]-alanine N-acetyltransferase